MGLILRICDFVFVLRPLILIPAWSFYLVGAARGRGGGFAVYWGVPGAMSLLSLTSILASAYLLNQIFDRESDEQNDKIFYLSRGIFRARTLVVMAAVFFVVASLSFQEVSGTQRFPLVIALLLSLLYSLPPVRLCARPFLDMLANAFGYGGIAYVIGFAVFDFSMTSAWLHAAPFVMLVAATFIHTTILDVDGDRSAHKISTAVFLGERAAANLAAALHAAGLVIAILTGDLPAVAITGLSLPFTIVTLFRRTRSASAMQIQSATLIITIAAIFFWPVYAFVVVPLIALSRVYYRLRFGITYPGPQKSA